MSKPVEVRQVDGIPVVVLNDHRAFNSGAELANEIIEQITSGDLPPANVEQIATAVAAAVGHRTSVDGSPAMGRMLEDLDPLDGEGESELLARVHEEAQSHAERGAHTPKPSVVKGSGTSVALGSVRGVMAGSTGSGENWTPGDGARKITQGIRQHYPDTRHPIFRMWRAIGVKVNEARATRKS